MNTQNRYDTRSIPKYICKAKHDFAKKCLRHSLPQLLNNTSENVKEKFYTHSIGGFSGYLKNILIETYTDTCNIVNCYICQHIS